MITPLFIGGLGMQEMLLIALVVLLFFGGKKIPELMKGLGKGVRSFKEGMNNVEKEIDEIKDILHYLPPALFARRSGDVIRCAGFSREAHQHGTGWAVHHPHESRTMCRCSLCIAIHPLPVVSLRIACFIC